MPQWKSNLPKFYGIKSTFLDELPFVFDNLIHNRNERKDGRNGRKGRRIRSERGLPFPSYEVSVIRSLQTSYLSYEAPDFVELTLIEHSTRQNIRIKKSKTSQVILRTFLLCYHFFKLHVQLLRSCRGVVRFSPGLHP